VDEKELRDLRKDVDVLRKDVDGFMADSALRNRANEIQFSRFEKELKDNTDMTKKVHDGVGDTLSILSDMGGAWRLLKRAGNAMKPIIVVGAVITAIWQWAKTGRWEWPSS
jgi:hypothetical protein